MNASRLLLHSAAAVLFVAASAHAASVSGTVTDKTTGKPASGDPIVLVDVQSGMSEVAHATTDASGRYTLNEPGNGPYLIRVTHQGAGYFIAAPQGSGPGDIPVYDVAAKVDGVSIEADVFEIETDPSGALHVTERYFVHNTSSPPRTEWSPKTFLINLPADATVAGVAAQRPTGLPTSVKLDSAGSKGQYAFNFPIQPDEGEKDTLFQVEYTVPYSGSFTFHPQVSLPAQSVGILLPKSISFTAGSGSVFQPVNQDPGIQTYVARNAQPGHPLEFSISGTGSMPREAQGGAQAGGETAGQAGAPNNGTPGGGIGTPINTPDPLSKYKWWILGVLALLLAAAAAFLLRRPAAVPGALPANVTPAQPGTSATVYSPAAYSAPASPAGKNAALLNALKEELFTLESEKIHGTISAEEYAEVKPALEIVLKRALKRSA